MIHIKCEQLLSKFCHAIWDGLCKRVCMIRHMGFIWKAGAPDIPSSKSVTDYFQTTFWMHTKSAGNATRCKFLAVGSLDWSFTLVTMGLIRLLMRCASTKSWQLLNLLPFLLVQTSTPSLYHMVIKVTEFSFTNVIIHLSGLSVFLTNRHTPEWSDEFNGPSTMFSH